MVETLPENGAFTRAVSLEARILVRKPRRLRQLTRTGFAPEVSTRLFELFIPGLSDGVAIQHTKNPCGTQMLATPDQQIWLMRPCADSNEGNPPPTSVQDRLSCNRCDGMLAYSDAT